MPKAIYQMHCLICGNVWTTLDPSSAYVGAEVCPRCKGVPEIGRLRKKLEKMERVLTVAKRLCPLHNDRDAYLHALYEYALEDEQRPDPRDYNLPEIYGVEQEENK